MAHRWLIVTTSILVVVSIVPLYRASGINFTPVEDESRFQVSVRLPGRFEHRRHAVARRPHLARDARRTCPACSAVQGNAGLTGGGGGGNNSGSIFVRLKPIAERDVSQQALMLQARKLVQPYRKAAVISVQGTGGLSFAGGRGAQIQYALVGPDLAKTRSVHRQGHGADGEEPGPRGRRSGLPAWPARAAHRHRPQACRRSRRAHPGRVADGQRPHRRPGGHDLQRRQRPVRGRPQGAGLVPADAGVAGLGDGAHRLGRARAAAQPRVVHRRLGTGADRAAQPAAADHHLGQPRAGHLAGARVRRRSKRPSSRSTWSRATTS